MERTDLIIAGIHVAIDCDCEWTNFFLRQFLAGHIVPAPPKTSNEEHLIVFEFPQTLDCSESPAENLLWKGRLADGTEILKEQVQGKTRLLVGGQVSITFESENNKIICTVSEQNTGNGSRRPQPGGYMLPLITYVLSSRERYVVHASAVASDGRAILLLGESGSGKTSTSLACSRQGFDFMGDDLVAIQKVGQDLLVHALLLKPTIRQEDGRKIPLDMFSETGVSVCRCAQLGAVIKLPILQGVPKKLELRPSHEVVQWLLVQGNNPGFCFDGQKWLDTAFNIAGRVKGWTWGPGALERIDTRVLREVLN